MSIGEKLYLAMVVAAFSAFLVMLMVLSWLDGRHTRAMAVSEKRDSTPPQQIPA